MLVTPPLGSNLDYAYDPTDIEIPGVGRVKRNSPLGQTIDANYSTEVQSRPATPIAVGQQQADFYLPMNKGLHEDYAAPGVTALTKLNAALEGSRTTTIRGDRQGQAVARQAQPGDTIRFFNDYGKTGLARVTGTPGQIDQEIFTGEVPRPQEIANGPAQAINENFVKQRVAAGDPNWNVIYPDDSPPVYGYQGEKGFVDINDPSPFPQLTQTQMTPAREAMIGLGLTEGQNEAGIKRTLFGGQNNRGIGGAGSVIPYEVIPGTEISVDQLPAIGQQRIGELQNRQDYQTEGEGFVAYKDLDYRPNPVFGGAVEMVPGSDKYDPVIANWLEGNQVNADSKYLTPGAKRARASLKSRWEDGTGWVERPITQSIRNLVDSSPAGVAAFDKARLMENDLSRFYKPAVTEDMLDAGLPHESQLLTADQVIGQIDRESKNQLAQGNLETIDQYLKPADIRPPGSGYGNYNLENKYANISDQMPLNDAYNQQWGEKPPDIYTHYSGGPVRYNDAGVAVGFGDKNLQTNVEMAEGTRNFLPVSDVYTIAPQYTYSEKRNVIQLQPEVANLPAMQSAQDLLRQHLDMETPSPLGVGTYKDSPMMTTGMTLGDMPAVSSVVPGAFLQDVDERGNFIVDPSTQKPRLTPYVPSADLNQRSDELSRVVIQSGNNSQVPYVGVAGEVLMNDNYKVSDVELMRDPDTLPDAIQKIGQLQDSARNQRIQGNVNSTSPTATANLNRTLSAYAGADAAGAQSTDLRSSYDALASIDPAMNVATEKFNVGVQMAPGQSSDAIATLLQLNGIDPVVEGQLVMGQGELPVNKHVALAQSLRANLHPGDSALGDVPSDPEMAALRQQWKGERAAVMGKTADQLAQIKDLHGQRRLDAIGRPVLNTNSGGDEMMRTNLNFYADDDFGMLGDAVHPMDRMNPPAYKPDYIPSPWNGTSPGSGGGVSVVDLSSAPMQSGTRALPPSIRGGGMIPLVQGEFVDVPTSSFQAQMADATPGFEFNPSQADPIYTGQGRPVPGGGMVHAPAPVAAASNPWYKTKPGMLGLGGAAALGLGALAYANAKRVQDEEDLQAQQLAQMTGWR